MFEVGEVAALMRAHDWSNSPLGPPEKWPQGLCSAVSLMLDSKFPMFVAWGPELGFLYNDAYAVILGRKHPAALGARFNDIWSEIWDDVWPLVQRAMAGEAIWQENLPLVMNRQGHDEQTWFTFSYSPARDETGQVAGMFCACTETTGQVLAEAALRESQARASGVLEGMAEGFALLDRQFRILDLNAEAMRLETRPREAIVGRSHWDAYPGSETSELGQLYKNAMTERVPVSLEHRYVWEDGHEAWLEMRAYPVAQGLAIFYRDITERREGETRQGFLLELSDRVRDLGDPVAVTSTAAELLGRQLHVARAGYGEIDDAQEVATVARDWTNGDVPTLAGEARLLDGFGPAVIGEMKAGRTLVVEDFRSDPRAGTAYAATWESIGTRALIVVPLVRSGRLRAFFYLHEPQPRAWSDAEVRLAESAAERTWDAVERATAEAALRASEAQFEAIANSIDQMIWSTQPDGSHDYYNQRWYDYTGVPQGSTDGEAWNGMFHPDDQERAWARWHHSLETGAPYHIEYRLRHRSGEYRWVIGRAQPVRDERGTITRWYGTCTDIHDLKVAEESLLESRDQLAAESQALEILNATGTQVAAELGLETVVQKVVDAGVELTGARFGAFFYNVLDDKGASYMLYALSGAERHQFETFGMPRATSVFAPTFRGEGVIRSADILQDERYGQNAPHAGMPEGHLPVRSYLAVPVTSRSGEVIGGLFFGHEEPGVFSERSERVMTGLAAQAAIAIDNARLFDAVQKANAELEERVRTRTIELEQAHEALRQSQKMEAVGQLTGGIAHDFNNLLTGVIGSLDMMQRRIAKGETDQVERYATTAITAANRAAALTHRLLAFARRQPLDPKPVNANRLVTGMEELLRRTIGESVQLEIVTAGGLWQTLCDPHQLESAILNLAINARDAMPDGGKLTIETCNTHIDKAYAAKLRDVTPGQYICICVTDTGTGMTKDTIEKAFEPFFTTKPIGQGTGLGLSMVYGFTRQSEGYARIYSEVGDGTTIKLYLPRYYGEAEDAEENQGEFTDAHRAEAGEVVLVVEDETAVRDLVVDVLEELGYHTVEAVDGPAGLKLLQSKMRLDLLITDIGLPGLNGRQLADAAREHRPDLKVLFMTGYAENATIANGFLEPGMQMITKPFAIEALVTRIRDMIEQGT